MPSSFAEARVRGVSGNVVTIDCPEIGIMKNEVAFIRMGDARLKAEVLRIAGRTADLQVFEDTTGIRVGDPVELSGEMLSVSLGPGLLGTIFDGLQNPLETLAARHGFFLPRGRAVEPLDCERRWLFTPAVGPGARLYAGQVLGTVPEGRFVHKIMVPFSWQGEAEVTRIEGGEYSVADPVARLRDAGGGEREIRLAQRWPVRLGLARDPLAQGLARRLYPSEPLFTTVRIIDTFFPVARGGTACIPGPFGAGKTVLQSLISRYAAVDIVVLVACGERAGEVVETIHAFAGMEDAGGKGRLMDRSVIICNTSSMPVAAREASLYTGITIGEYYRQMGYHTLLIADSTSRWAQALRETSANLEEIPGDEAFPAYLDSHVKAMYERAGVLRCGDGAVGSLTLIGTVSPAGGNFEEPVTQSTLGTVKAFIGLSAERAYKRFYPAVDPLISWSRYTEQLRPYFVRAAGPEWPATVAALLELLARGEAVRRMMQVTGEEGISLEDFVTYQKALFLDRVYLQQDAYDAVDVSTSPERQQEILALLGRLLGARYRFEDKEAARDFFFRMTGAFRNLNYAGRGTPEYARLVRELEKLSAERLINKIRDPKHEIPNSNSQTKQTGNPPSKFNRSPMRG